MVFVIPAGSGRAAGIVRPPLFMVFFVGPPFKAFFTLLSPARSSWSFQIP